MAFLSIIILLVACYVYVSHRGGDMVLYSLLGIDGNSSLFIALRQNATDLPAWVIYNIPDGLWLLSYLLIIEAIWGNEKQRKIWFIIPVILFAFLLEVLQYIGFFPGTGDVLDMLCYSVAIAVYLGIIKLKQYFYEKLD